MFPTGFGLIPNPPLINSLALAQAHAQAQANAAALQRAALLSSPMVSAATQVRPQQPMLVPPGMADQDYEDGSAQQSSHWQEYTSKEGRVYYYNKVTKETTWTKPDELKTSAEKTTVWKEYKAPDGRPYFYNTQTKETTWTKPDGLDASQEDSKEDVKPTVSAAPAKEEKEESEMEKAMKATLASINIVAPPERTAKEEHEGGPDEQNLKRRQTEIFRELLRDKYNDNKITATCNWEHAVKYIQHDPRFRILNKVSEKKQIFNAWKVQRQKEERDEKRLAIKKAKEELEKWLQEQPKMKPTLKYSRARDIFSKEPVWQAVQEEDRIEIFRDVQKFVRQRDDEKEKTTRDRNVKRLAEILDGMDQINYQTTWAQAQRLLIENPLFAEDTTLQSMDKEDALIVFEGHIRNAEQEHEKEKEVQDRRIKRQERKAREAFQQFLEELHKKGELTSVSLWSSLYPAISADPRFDSMLSQTGSTPLDLFKFYVDGLKGQFTQDRRVIKTILANAGKVVTVNTPFDEFSSWVAADEKGIKVDRGNMKLCYNSFVEKAESKEKEVEREESRKKRRFESEFRNLLRSQQPEIDLNTEWESVKSKIDKEKAYLELETDEIRQKCFEDYKNSLGESCGHHHTSKKKKKEKKKKRDSDSEGEIREKDEKEREKKKKRKRSRDRSDDERSRKRKKSSRRSYSRSPSSDADRKSDSD